MLKILVTGGSGYIAQRIYNKYKNIYNIEVVGRKNFDIINRKETRSFFEGKTYDVLIHTAIVGGSRLEIDKQENVYKNLMMFENLLENSFSYKKIINIGSGAEIYAPETPYGLSKNIISKLINNISYAYNLRVYGVFDECELPSRFIKSCILACKNNQIINIHQNKLFDYFYMEDLLNIIDYYILNNDIIKCVDCCYQEKKTLKQIAEYVCSILEKNPNETIQINNAIFGSPYIGRSNLPKLNFVGLEAGIFNTIKHLQTY